MLARIFWLGDLFATGVLLARLAVLCDCQNCSNEYIFAKYTDIRHYICVNSLL